MFRLGVAPEGKALHQDLARGRPLLSITDTAPLFRSFQLKSLDLKNRIVMAPMTRAMALGGIPREANAAYYRRQAKGEVGLILSEGTVVDRPASRNHPDRAVLLRRGRPRRVEGRHRGRPRGWMAPQLWHTGSPKPLQWEPDAPVESPSGLLAPDTLRGEAMSEEAIADTVAAFAKAATEAKRLGFNAVEAPGAHGQPSSRRRRRLG